MSLIANTITAIRSVPNNELNSTDKT